MNPRITAYSVVLIFMVGRAFGAMESPGARSPIGSPTQVPSSDVTSATQVPSANRPGAIPGQPNLYGTVGDLIMTGNIGGGKHFRGFVPYGSSFYSGWSLQDPGSLSVSSFIRRSYGFEPYYDPGRTVSSLRRGTVSGLSSPAVSDQGRSPYVSRQWLNSFDVTELLRPPQQRPLVPSAHSIEAILDQQVSRELIKRQTPAEESTKALPGFDRSVLLPTQSIPAPLEPAEPLDKQEVQTPEKTESSFYQQMKRSLFDPSSLIGTEAIPGETGDTASQMGEEGEPGGIQPPELGRARGLLRPEDVVNPILGRIALKDYEDYQHLAEAKASAYLTAAERFMKKGEYYKAADAFELAFVWDRKNTLLLLARSHALFAAGEYMSSAYYLSEALNQEPRLVEPAVDWGSLLNTRDDYENRLVELSTWQQRSNSAELAFLMGYVLYRDDKLTRAKISADYALDHMPENPAAEVLVKAIDKTLNPKPASPEGSGNP